MLKMEFDLYKQSDKKLLRNNYPSFYLQLFKYIESLENHWFFVSCYDQDSDGNRFSIELNDGRNHMKYISSIRNNGIYDFTVFNGK